MRYLTNVITFDGEIIDSVNKRRIVDVASLDFSKAFDASAILIDKLLKYKLEKWTLRWIENWLTQWTQISNGPQSREGSY